MADYNFILTIAGVNTAINLNDNFNTLLSETPDLATITSVFVPSASAKLLIDFSTITNFGFLIIQNIDDNNDVDIILEDAATVGRGAFKRLQPNQMMFLNSENLVSQVNDDAFTVVSTIEKLLARGVNGTARIKIVHIR